MPLAKGSSTTLINTATPATGKYVNPGESQRTFQCELIPPKDAPAGPRSATLLIEGSNAVDSGWLPLATVTLDQATPIEGFVLEAAWRYVRAKVTAVQGGTVKVILGV